MELFRCKPTETLDARLTDDVGRLLEEMRMLPPARYHETLLRQVRQDEIARQIDAWISSPGLRAPT
ncbi:hypothetical protein JQ554_07020 [Bradyrhizobium diazoefficiens]|jgi:hypothetical protein|nr:hypothetical protein [Bradyrhizobium diazoefficiens]MBR0963847.1 hypothetical protein [Bradyrhizobium diazoefficiens]MBR0977998.1 hypothetical protein [Bradyrhizobium diazoefficiens]MBR1007507.1 hypothetical protein [Bradyrhizobium diazoefficiens]MBR1012650.1 hypothetical protein [Bradyrhizobium diazoefficiens]MBR1053587.1 hypothetical protein [Bradyrhizobium diazoefficiens]